MSNHRVTAALVPCSKHSLQAYSVPLCSPTTSLVLWSQTLTQSGMAPQDDHVVDVSKYVGVVRIAKRIFFAIFNPTIGAWTLENSEI